VPLQLCTDVTILPAGADRWIIHNVRARTALGVDGRGLDLLTQAYRDDFPSEEDLSGSYPVWKISSFTNTDGLLADPTRMTRNADDWPDAETLSGEDSIKCFTDACLLIDDTDAYDARFDEKADVLDRRHFGNFHQQLGQHLMLDRRMDPDQWWLDQKFESDFSAIRNNLYGAVQEYFLKGYFNKRFRQRHRVLDLGCGPGFFSNLAAATGAEVLGLDPNEKFLSIAAENAGPSASFQVAPVGTPEALDDLADDSFDFVLMTDALLFYFVSADPTKKGDLDVLLKDIGRVLKPGGRFISVEPHYMFWLAPWMGGEDRPYTIFSEYRNRKFAVMPTWADFLSTFARRGWTAVAIEEAKPDPAYKDVDPRAYAFAAEFPLWQLFEFAPFE